LDRKVKAVPLAEGVVNRISHIFWKKYAGDTVPESLSSSPRTFLKCQ
jgi:hypothetical protein